MLDQIRLVYLIGQFRHDDTFLFIPGITLNQSPGPDPDNSPARPVSRDDALFAVDKAGGRKVGTLNMAHQFINGDLGIFNHRNSPADDLTKIVWGNIRRHATAMPDEPLSSRMGRRAGRTVGSCRDSS